MYSAFYCDGEHRVNVFSNYSELPDRDFFCWDCDEPVTCDGQSFHHVDSRSTCRPVSNSPYRNQLQTAYFSPFQCEPLIGGHRPAAFIGNTALEFVDEPLSSDEFWLRCRDYRRCGFNSVWVFRVSPRFISPIPPYATADDPAARLAVCDISSHLPVALADYTPPMGDHSLLGPALIVGNDRATVARAMRRLDGYLGVSVYLDITSDDTHALYRLDSFGSLDNPGDRSIVSLDEPVSPESLIAAISEFAVKSSGTLIEPDSSAPAIALIESFEAELRTTARMRSVYTTIRLRNASGRYARSFEVDLSSPSAAFQDMVVWLVRENAVLAPRTGFVLDGFAAAPDPLAPQEVRSALKSDFRAFFQNGEVGALARLFSSRLTANRMTPPPTSRFLDFAAPGASMLRILCFDTETTGLEEDDEVVQLSIADAATGEQVLNEYFRPSDALMERGWDEAAAVTGIWPDDVRDCRSLRDPEVFEFVQSVLDSADLLLGYHVVYDIHMLEKAGFRLRGKTFNDPMYGFAAHYWFMHPDETHTTKKGKVISPWLDWSFNPYTNRKGKWISKNLSFAAEQFGIIDFGAHDSMNDVMATIEVWRHMCDIQRSIEANGYARGPHGEVLSDPAMRVCWSDSDGKPVTDPDGFAISFASDYSVEDLENLDN